MTMQCSAFSETLNLMNKLIFFANNILLAWCLTFVLCHHFHPRCWVNFHQGIRNKYHMHAIEDTLQLTSNYFF